VLERAKGQFTIEGQVEDIFGGASGAARLARVSQTCVFTGTLEGESIAEYTAVFPRDGDRRFQGFQRITGKLGGREGSFVVCVTGDYPKGRSRGTWSIVPKSGTGDFTHIRGNGDFSQTAGGTGTYTLEFDLRKPRKMRVDESVSDTGAAAAEPAAPIAIETEAEQAPVARATEPAKPSRRRTTKSTPLASPDVPTADPSSRRAKRPVVATETPTLPAPAPADAQPKRAPKRAAPAEPDGATTAEAEHAIAPALPPKTRRRRKPADLPREQIETPPHGTAEPIQAKPGSKYTRIPEAQHVVETGPAPEPSTRKRVRKSASEPVPEPAAEPEPIVATKRGGRKKSAPTPTQAPLTIVPEKPARTRKSKAA